MEAAGGVEAVLNGAETALGGEGRNGDRHQGQLLEAQGAVAAGGARRGGAELAQAFGGQEVGLQAFQNRESRVSRDILAF